MTSGELDPSRRSFPAVEPERPPRALGFRLLAILLLVLVASAVVVALVAKDSSKTHQRRGTPTPAQPLRLPSAARSLPGVSGDAGQSFGVLGLLVHHATEITREQALERYDHMTGVTDRHAADRRVYTALVSAAYLDRGQLGRGSFWVVSVWYHPPNIGISPQHQWCVDHGLIDALTDAADGHISACLPVGEPPNQVK